MRPAPVSVRGNAYHPSSILSLGVDHPARRADMTTGALIVICLRLLVPLLILRRPLLGGVAAMVVDTLDVVLIELIGLGGYGSHYQATDKLLDTYYLSFEFYVALRWQNPYARWVSILLFPYRMLGVALFELTERRIMLFIFPNLFENWWLYCVVTMGSFPRLAPRSMRSTAIALLVLLVPKMGQEYLLHYAEAQPWDWIKRNLLRGAI